MALLESVWRAHPNPALAAAFLLFIYLVCLVGFLLVISPAGYECAFSEHGLFRYKTEKSSFCTYNMQYDRAIAKIAVSMFRAFHQKREFWEGVFLSIREAIMSTKPSIYL